MSVYGPNLVDEGTFNNAGAAWTLGADWSIVAEEAVGTGGDVSADHTITQSLSVTAGKTYRLTSDVAVTDGTTAIVSMTGGGGQSIKTGATSNLDETFILGSSDDTDLTFIAYDISAPIGTLTIDNVSLTEVSVADEIEKAVYDILRFDSTVSGLVSTRIYPQVIPQNTDYPAISYHWVAAPRDHSCDGMTDLVPARVQFNVYAQTYAELRALVDAVRGVLDSIQTTCGTVEITSSLMIDEIDLIERTPGTDKLTFYGRALDFRITYRES